MCVCVCVCVCVRVYVCYTIKCNVYYRSQSNSHAATMYQLTCYHLSLHDSTHVNSEQPVVAGITLAIRRASVNLFCHICGSRSRSRSE